MKPVHVLAAIGVIGALALGGWYFYMGQNPPWEVRQERGIDLPAGGEKPAGETKKMDAPPMKADAAAMARPADAAAAAADGAAAAADGGSAADGAAAPE
jgi:hypothetical protein